MNHAMKNSLAASAFLLITLSLSACLPTNNTDKDDAVDNGETENLEDNGVASTGQIATKIEFPQYIEGLSSLLHPIVPLSVSDNENNTLSSLKYRSDNQPNAFEEVDTYHYQTYASNIVFDDIATGNVQKLLPNDNFIIQQLFLPYSAIGQPVLDENFIDLDSEQNTVPEVDTDTTDVPTLARVPSTLFNYAIYHINETPYQEDTENKNIFQQQSLYMSDNTGRQLIKLHPDNEFVQMNKWMPQTSRYYFITRSDSDSNGLINEKDQTHNYQIDFTTDRPMVKAYDFAQ